MPHPTLHPTKSSWAHARGRLRRWAAARTSRLAASWGLVVVGGCAPIPPPDILAELERTREAPAVVVARALVPSAFDKAEALRIEANRALEEGDFSGAQILGEQSRAAYALTVAAARVARAQRSEAEAMAEADAIATELASFDAEQQQVAADVAALQLRMAAASATVAVGGEASAATSADRASAVLALRVQARLLCTAARLLEPASSPAASDPTAGREGLRELEARLREASEGASLEQAVELRQACARELTESRRAAQPSTSSSAETDRLLVALSQLVPGGVGRDERGVVVTLRPAFDGGRIGASDASTLASIGKVAREHPGFPVLLVVHDAEVAGRRPPAGFVGGEQRGEQLTAALGMETTVELAGTAQPVLPEGRYQARNERVELVFVSPAPE